MCFHIQLYFQALSLQHKGCSISFSMKLHNSLNLPDKGGNWLCNLLLSACQCLSNYGRLWSSIDHPSQVYSHNYPPGAHTRLLGLTPQKPNQIFKWFFQQQKFENRGILILQQWQWFKTYLAFRKSSDFPCLWGSLGNIFGCGIQLSDRWLAPAILWSGGVNFP